MRIFSQSGLVVTYPNSVHFAFTPALIHATGMIRDIIVTIKCEATSQTYREAREAIGGECVIDIQRYLQMLFTNLAPSDFDYSSRISDSQFVRSVVVDVNIAYGVSSTYTLSFDVECIWGALDAGDEYGGHKVRVWFTKYPFTFNAPARADGYFDVRADNNPSQVIAFDLPTVDDGKGFHHYIFNPALIFDVFPVDRRLYVAIPNALHIENDDEGVDVASYELRVDRCSSGVYLRWIDRQGQYAYYLFKQTARGYEVKEDGAFQRNDMRNPARYINGVNVASYSRYDLSQNDTLTLVAPLVDDQIYDYLLDLAQSPIVDQFMGYGSDNAPQWRRVRVAPGTRSRSTDPMQDFTINIYLPEKNTQKL